MKGCWTKTQMNSKKKVKVKYPKKSIGNKKRWASMSTKERNVIRHNMSIGRQGIVLSRSHRKALSKALKGRKFSISHRKNLSIATKGRKITWGRKISVAYKKYLSRQTPSQKAKINRKLSLSCKKHWERLTIKQKTAKVRKSRKRLILLPNKPELKLQKILNTYFPNEFAINIKGKVSIAGKFPDFVSRENQKILIEMFGNYWHGKAITGLTRQDAERQRKKVFSKYGFTTVIVWEDELKNINKVVEKVSNEIIRKNVT